MKKVLLLALALIAFSCNSDDKSVENPDSRKIVTFETEHYINPTKADQNTDQQRAQSGVKVCTHPIYINEYVETWYTIEDGDIRWHYNHVRRVYNIQLARWEDYSVPVTYEQSVNICNAWAELTDQ